MFLTPSGTPYILGQNDPNTKFIKFVLRLKLALKKCILMVLMHLQNVVTLLKLFFFIFINFPGQNVFRSIMRVKNNFSIGIILSYRQDKVRSQRGKSTEEYILRLC